MYIHIHIRIHTHIYMCVSVCKHVYVLCVFFYPQLADADLAPGSCTWRLHGGRTRGSLFLLPAAGALPLDFDTSFWQSLVD